MQLIPVAQLADYLDRPGAPVRVSATDGEWRCCPSCARRGYGADAWLPMTSEFWATHRGRLILSACKACRSDVAGRVKGIVPGPREAMAA
jgi:hypothetical protein